MLRRKRLPPSCPKRRRNLVAALRRFMLKPIPNNSSKGKPKKRKSEILNLVESRRISFHSCGFARHSGHSAQQKPGAIGGGFVARGWVEHQSRALRLCRQFQSFYPWHKHRLGDLSPLELGIQLASGVWMAGSSPSSTTSFFFCRGSRHKGVISLRQRSQDDDDGP